MESLVWGCSDEWTRPLNIFNELKRQRNEENPLITPIVMDGVSRQLY